METAGEIILEIREKLTRCGVFFGEDIRKWLDRLEAAWKRQEHPSVGNAAAMREVCVNIAGYAQTAKCHTEDGHILGYLDQIEKWAKSAISEPARNCDLYSDAREALKAHEEAFNESNFHHGECKLGCPDCDDYAIRCEIKWLLAPAAERKEAGNGR